MASQMRPIDPHLSFLGIYKESFGLVGAHPKKLLLLTAAFILPLVFVSTAVNQALKGTLDAEQTFWLSTHPENNGSKVTVAESASEIAFNYFGGPFSSWPRYFLRPVFGETEDQTQVEVEHFLVERRRADGDYDSSDGGDYTSDGSETAPPPPEEEVAPPPPPLDSDYADQIPPPPEDGHPNQAPAPDEQLPGEDFSPPPEAPSPDGVQQVDPGSPPPPEDLSVSALPPATELLAPNGEPTAPVEPTPSPGPEVPATTDDDDESGVEDPESDPFPESPESPPEDPNSNGDGGTGDGSTGNDGTNGDGTNGDGTNGDGSNADGTNGDGTNSDSTDRSEESGAAQTGSSDSSGSSKLGLIIFLYVCSFSLLITLSLVSVVAITSAVAGIYGTKYGIGHIWQPMDFFFGDILRSIPETAIRVFGTAAITMTIFFGSLAVILQVFRASSIELQIFLLFLYAVGVVYVTTIWSLALPVVVLERPMTWGFKPLIRSFHLLTAAKRVWLALGINLSLFYGGLLINFLTSLLARAMTGNTGFGWSFLYVLMVSLVMTVVIFITLLVHTVFFCICKARCETDKDALQNVKYVALSEKSSGLLEEGALKPKTTRGYEDELDDL